MITSRTIGDPASVKEHLEDYKEFFGRLPKTSDEPLDVPVELEIDINGHQVTNLKGRLLLTGGGFHNDPYSYEIEFKPMKVTTKPTI
jgi:hypothetical protein